eukprot:CAMPEP_0171062340 /NCGR_PEP_ID=MMETSP0766_2-20121228/5010_1 /TAXON_ID=439317 /ORGANISM="Gambierdiscus australes, Strain CAWD 149" /LENGTH=63 /DNA_ID=CAMNT_0011518137 /DNA_START=74 /DNA_END=266 /DNA_ORIENTATION=-
MRMENSRAICAEGQKSCINELLLTGSNPAVKGAVFDFSDKILDIKQPSQCGQGRALHVCCADS